MSRRSRPNPLAWLVVLLVLVAVLNAVAVIERLAGPLLLLAAVLVVWALARHRRPVPPGHPPTVIRGRAQDDAEVIRLRAEVAHLCAELDEARDTAHAAWQDATEPGGATVIGMRARLLADRLSGAHRLGGGQ
jgi:hypothetical protein